MMCRSWMALRPAEQFPAIAVFLDVRADSFTKIPETFARHPATYFGRKPDALLALSGFAFGHIAKSEVDQVGIAERVEMTGGNGDRLPCMGMHG
jgi:hypothetical protein